MAGVTGVWWQVTNRAKLKCSAGWSWDNTMPTSLAWSGLDYCPAHITWCHFHCSQPASQPARFVWNSNLSWLSTDWVCWEGEQNSYRLAPDNQQSYGPSLSWRLFALWALPALLPIKILTCWHAWMLGSAGRSSYWKMPDILVKYANTTPTLRFLARPNKLQVVWWV